MIGYIITTRFSPTIGDAAFTGVGIGIHPGTIIILIMAMDGDHTTTGHIIITTGDITDGITNHTTHIMGMTGMLSEQQGDLVPEETIHISRQEGMPLIAPGQIQEVQAETWLRTLAVTETFQIAAEDI